MATLDLYLLWDVQSELQLAWTGSTAEDYHLTEA